MTPIPALLLALVLLPLGAARALPDDPAGLDGVPALAGLRERWQGAMEDMKIPGCAVAVLEDGEVLALQGLGVRDAAGNPVDPDTMFYIASITKTYVGTAVVALAEQGALDLDDAVADILPRFRLAGGKHQGITVRDLLCHRKGLNCGPAVFLDAYSGQITEDRYYHWLSQEEPSGTLDYTNVHFTLLGRVIEELTGDPWRDHLESALFAPLQMSRTTAYASRLYADENAARPMAHEDGAFVECRVRKTDNTMHAAGGLGTSARDAARWILAQRPGGALESSGLLTPEARGEMHALQAAFPSPNGRIRRMEGFGLAWQRGTFRGRPYLVHGGGYVGTATHMSFLPEDDLGVVVLTNAGMGNALATIISIDVYDRLLGEEGHDDLLPLYVADVQRSLGRATSEREPRLEAGSLSRDPAEYVGRYEHEHWGHVDVGADDDGLSARMGDLVFAFRPVATDRFDLSAGNGAVTFDAAFLAQGDELVLLMSDDSQVIRFDRAR